MEGKKRQPLGIELVKRRIVTEEDIARALDYQRTEPRKKIGAHRNHKPALHGFAPAPSAKADAFAPFRSGLNFTLKDKLILKILRRMRRALVVETIVLLHNRFNNAA